MKVDVLLGLQWGDEVKKKNESRCSIRITMGRRR